MDRDLIAKQSFHSQRNGDGDIRKEERTEGAISTGWGRGLGHGWPYPSMCRMAHRMCAAFLQQEVKRVLRPSPH